MSFGNFVNPTLSPWLTAFLMPLLLCSLNRKGALRKMVVEISLAINFAFPI